jgi:hypothetical protein
MGVALCRRCGLSWCEACLVYSFGPKKPPYCMSCAMFASGVRSSATLPAMSRKDLKAQMKAMKAQAKAAAKAATGQPQGAEDPIGPEEPVEVDAALAGTDWSTPWWEDRQPAALAD